MDIKETVKSLSTKVEFNEGVIKPSPGPSTVIKVESNLFEKTETDRFIIVGEKLSERLNQEKMEEMNKVKCEEIVNQTFVNVKIEPENFESCVSVERTNLIDIKKEVDDVSLKSELVNNSNIALIDQKDLFFENSDLDTIKCEMDNYTLKAEQLNEEYDIPIVKSEAEFLDQPCSSKQFQHSLKQKSTKRFIMKRKLKYSCPVCCKNYFDVVSRNSHLNGHFGKHSVMCSTCGQIVNRKEEFINHVLTHYTNIFLFRNKRLDTNFQCEVCSKLFIDGLKLLNHLKTHPDYEVNQQENISKCTPKIEMSEQRLFVTNEIDSTECNTNSRRKVYTCEICSKQYQLRHHFMRHLSDHNTENPCKCLVCSKTFKNNLDLAAHRKVHIEEKRMQSKQLFKCKICLKEFSYNYSLHHWRSHIKEKPRQCKICKAEFIQKDKLFAHMKIHKPPFNYEMSPKEEEKECVKDIKVHTKKAFQCEFCLKSFQNNCRLGEHIRIHTGEKPFKCEICSQQFAKRGNCVRHINKFHKGDSMNDLISEKYLS